MKQGFIRGAIVVAMLLVSLGTTTAATAAQARHGVVTTWGGRVLPPVQPGTRFKAIVGGYQFSAAITSDGAVASRDPTQSRGSYLESLARKRRIWSQGNRASAPRDVLTLGVKGV